MAILDSVKNIAAANRVFKRVSGSMDHQCAWHACQFWKQADGRGNIKPLRKSAANKQIYKSAGFGQASLV